MCHPATQKNRVHCSSYTLYTLIIILHGRHIADTYHLHSHLPTAKQSEDGVNDHVQYYQEELQLCDSNFLEQNLLYEPNTRWRICAKHVNLQYCMPGTDD